MSIISARHVIAVPDLEASVAFYRDTPGFRIMDIGDPGWRFFVQDGACITAKRCPDAASPSDLGDHSFFAYFERDDIDAYYDKVRAADAEITKPLRDEPCGMREFGHRTIDGHRMRFAMAVSS